MLACLFKGAQEGATLHNFAYAQLGNNWKEILIAILSCMFEYLWQVGWYEEPRWRGINPVLCLLALERFRKVDCEAHTELFALILNWTFVTRANFDLSHGYATYCIRTGTGRLFSGSVARYVCVNWTRTSFLKLLRYNGSIYLLPWSQLRACTKRLFRLKLITLPVCWRRV